MGVAPLVMGGLALANTFLNSDNGGGEPNITTVTPEAPKVPNQAEINQTAYNRILAGNPWTLSPYRTMDFFRNTPVTPNYVPQYNPQQGIGQYTPTNNQMLMGNWQQRHPALQQPQYSPMSWGMNLGAMFQQLAPLLQQYLQQNPGTWGGNNASDNGTQPQSM